MQTKLIMKDLLVKRFIIGTFVCLYAVVSVISTIHVIDFFELSNGRGMSIALAVAFEIGAAACLASLVTLQRMNKTLVWALFIAVTAMQMNGNLYYAFTHLDMDNFTRWVELFGLSEEEPLYQQRVIAAVSGAILPLVALGFIKSLVDYIRPEQLTDDEVTSESVLVEPDAPEQPEEEWDEDHAHDMVLGQMVEEIEKEDPDFMSESGSFDDAMAAAAQSEMQDYLNSKRGA